MHQASHSTLSVVFGVIGVYCLVQLYQDTTTDHVRLIHRVQDNSDIHNYMFKVTNTSEVSAQGGLVDGGGSV